MTIFYRRRKYSFEPLVNDNNLYDYDDDDDDHNHEQEQNLSSLLLILLN